MEKGGICGCYYFVIFHPIITTTQNIYSIWRTSNKLVSVRHEISNKQRLTSDKIAKIIFSVENERNSQINLISF